jgi:hypothetical protein
MVGVRLVRVASIATANRDGNTGDLANVGG